MIHGPYSTCLLKCMRARSKLSHEVKRSRLGLVFSVLGPPDYKSRNFVFILACRISKLSSISINLKSFSLKVEASCFDNLAKAARDSRVPGNKWGTQIRPILFGLAYDLEQLLIKYIGYLLTTGSYQYRPERNSGKLCGKLAYVVSASK